MVKSTRCEIKCLTCKNWVASNTQFEDAKSFFASADQGAVQPCSFCGHTTSYNKESMRFRVKDEAGHVTYEEGKDTP
jgi:hypothetical protein